MSGEATRRQQDNQQNDQKNPQDQTEKRYPGRQDEGRQPNPEKDNHNPTETNKYGKHQDDNTNKDKSGEATEENRRR